MDEDWLTRVRALLSRPAADQTRTPAPPPQPTIGPQTRSAVPPPKSGALAAVLRSLQPSPDTPGGMLNEMLNPLRAGAQTREMVGEAMQSARQGNVGRAAGMGALAAASMPMRIRLAPKAAQAVADDWHMAGSFENPLNPRQRAVMFGEALGAYEVVPSVTSGGYTIQSIVSRKPGGGRAALQHLIQRADERGVPLDLSPEPFGSKRMSRKQLMDWYQRYGFSAPDERGIMHRAPQPPK